MNLPDRLHGVIAIDTEGKDPYLPDRGPGWPFKENLDHGIVGISICCDNFSDYLPIAHEAGGNMEKDLVVKWLNFQLSDSTQTKVFANAQYDLGWLRRLGVKVAGRIEDILIQAPLIDENRGVGNYGLDSIAKDYIGEGKDESLLLEGFRSLNLPPSKKKKLDIKGNIWRMHPRYVAPYAIQDAKTTLKVWKVFNQKIEQEGLQGIYELELALIPVLMEMRQRGARVDIKRCEELVEIFSKRENEYLEEIRRLTGISVSLTASSSKALALKSQGIELPKTAKTGKDSVTREVLEHIVKTTNNPVANMINEASKLRKAREDFLISNILEKHENGRIYANFNQLMSDEGGTIGGRLSSAKPNLQNQYSPKKDVEIGTEIRSVWLPEEDETWGSVDLMSQEPRMTVHYAAITNQKGAEEIAEKYRKNPYLDFHQTVADMASITRKQAKPINLGLAYGMSETTLCHDLGLPTVWVAKIRVNKQEILIGKYGSEREATEAHLAASTRYRVPPSLRWNVKEVAGAEGEELLRKYHEGAPFLKGLMQLAKNKAAERGYIITIGGRRCRFVKNSSGKYDFTYKALNRLIQGSSADQVKRAMVNAYNAGLRMISQVHDEINITAQDRGQIYLLKQIMEDAIKLCIPSVGEASYGPNWGHQTKLPELSAA